MRDNATLRFEYILSSYESYISFTSYVKKDKYKFPVLMNICTLKEVKNLSYRELIEVNEIALLKLEKEISSNTLIFEALLYGR